MLYYLLTSVVHHEQSYYLSFVDSTDTRYTIVRMDDSTGQVLGAVTRTVTVPRPYPMLTPVGTGLMLSIAADKRVRVGWGPADLSRDFPLLDVLDTAPVSGTEMMAVDSKHVVMLWQSDMTVKVAELTCGP